MEHAENESIQKKNSYTGSGRNARRREANARQAPHRCISGETFRQQQIQSDESA